MPVDLLQLCPLIIHDLVALPVEEDLVPVAQRFLQRNTDTHSFNTAFYIHRYCLVVEHRICELSRLLHKRILESLVIVLRDLAMDTRRQMALGKANGWVCINSQLSARTNNLSHIVLARCIHPAAVEVRDLSIVELHHPNSVINIAVLGELGLEGSDTDGHNALHLG